MAALWKVRFFFKGEVQFIPILVAFLMFSLLIHIVGILNLKKNSSGKMKVKKMYGT